MGRTNCYSAGVLVSLEGPLSATEKRRVHIEHGGFLSIAVSRPTVTGHELRVSGRAFLCKGETEGKEHGGFLSIALEADSNRGRQRSLVMSSEYKCPHLLNVLSSWPRWVGRSRHPFPPKWLPQLAAIMEKKDGRVLELLSSAPAPFPCFQAQGSQHSS